MRYSEFFFYCCAAGNTAIIDLPELAMIRLVYHH